MSKTANTENLIAVLCKIYLDYLKYKALGIAGEIMEALAIFPLLQSVVGSFSAIWSEIWNIDDAGKENITLAINNGLGAQYASTPEVQKAVAIIRMILQAIQTFRMFSVSVV